MSEKKYYLSEKADVIKEFETDETSGLTHAEAAERLEKYGHNRLSEGKKTPLIKRILVQISDPMVIILLIAAIISGVTSVLQNESIADVFVILVVVIINTVLGVVQESKAEKAIEALKKMSAATSKVIRDGVQETVKSEEIVPGDIIVLEAGDAVPADGRLVEAVSFRTEEAALTGESLPINKTDSVVEPHGGDDVPLGDRKNMCYMGSCAVYGRAKMLVTGTGMDTEMGKIATAITEAEDGRTPLQKKLAQLSKILTFLVLGICVFMFVFSLIRYGDLSGKTVLDTFMIAVSLAVAAIPEGLVAVVTIVLSMGVTKMSAQNAIIRKMTAVETLGCTQIICSDKTGTLTQNKMTVVDTAGDREVLALGMMLCSDAKPGRTGRAEGEPTECALVNFFLDTGADYSGTVSSYPRVGEAPFDSLRKMMSTVHSSPEGIIQFTKGAPDEILSRCDSFLSDGKVFPMTESDRERFSGINRDFGKQALRVLALAQKKYDSAPSSFEAAGLETGLVFVGLCGMIDPIRPEVKDAVARCVGAGITPIMITGDHIITAIAIARQLGILTDESHAIRGADLNALSDEELDAAIDRYRVYARVQPEHKVRIVNAWRRRGMVTAMTGDGVNDAPSIKAADIGVGMGITGTDVTKNVADMILADDNFATIVSAVAEGRRIYDNICKCINFLLSSNLSEVISIFFATLLGFRILDPAHILFINLVTDSLPALALGAEKAERDVMKRKPRDSHEGIFAHGAGFDIMYQGLFLSAITVVAYFVGHFIETGVWEIAQSPDGMTMAFLTMSLAEIFHSFNLRSRRSIFTLKTQNVLLYLTTLAALALTAAVIFIPGLSSVFGFSSISFTEYLISVGLALTIIPATEIVKLVKKLIFRKKRGR
ncbi:MAG: cation-translocating P-type ATPase [Clostridia bacterium]|nr:cation-translocating P-type ATPase [Clostridia bacterium]